MTPHVDFSNNYGVRDTANLAISCQNEPPVGAYEEVFAFSEPAPLDPSSTGNLGKSPAANVPETFEIVTLASRDLVGSALLAHIAKVDSLTCDAGDEDSFFVADLGAVERAVRLWRLRLPNVKPHYAVKCNTDVEVIRLLASMGCGFDCATKGEIDTVLGLGVSPESIVYANPCKTNSYIRHARQMNVNLTTVDNAHELRKLHQFHSDCGVLLRLSTDDSMAQCRLSTKFGCTVETAVSELLPLAKELGIRIQGVAFHVGLGARDFGLIRGAVSDARAVFDAAFTLGFEMKVLDVGGGFETASFGELLAVLATALDDFFPKSYSEDIRFISEPGRFLVAGAFTLAAHVIARRDLFPADREATGTDAMVYVNDGVYGNMNCILFDHQHPVPRVLFHKGRSYYGNTADVASFSVWGPTCDGLDCVSSSAGLLANVEVGDWLYFAGLGAYTAAATTSFNGFKGKADVVYVNSEK